MAADTVEILASGTVLSASGNSTAFRMSLATMLAILVDVTAQSGSTPTLDLWLEGSYSKTPDDWWDVPADQVLESTTSATENSTSTNVRDIVPAATGASNHLGLFKHVPYPYGRLRWVLGGSTPTFTLGAWAVVK